MIWCSNEIESRKKITVFVLKQQTEEDKIHVDVDDDDVRAIISILDQIFYPASLEGKNSRNINKKPEAFWIISYHSITGRLSNRWVQLENDQVDTRVSSVDYDRNRFLDFFNFRCSVNIYLRYF